MPHFRDVINITLDWEGGYVDHPSDPGGKTNYGITERFARARGYRGHMRDLSLEQALQWYQESIWDRYKFYELNPQVGRYLFDMAVNHGQWTRIAQRAAKKYWQPLEVDGVWGEDTHWAFMNLDHMHSFLMNLMVERVRYGEEIVSRNRRLGTFWLGWIRRWLDRRWDV